MIYMQTIFFLLMLFIGQTTAEQNSYAYNYTNYGALPGQPIAIQPTRNAKATTPAAPKRKVWQRGR